MGARASPRGTRFPITFSMGGRLSRCALSALAAVAACLSLSASAAQAFEPRVEEDFFGVSSPELLAMTLKGQGANRDAQLSQMKAAGIDWVRTELSWSEIEPTAPVGATHTYTWSASDQVIEALASRGMSAFPILMATPRWARSADAVAAGCDFRSGLPASRAADYGAYAAALASRYGRGGSFWSARPSLPYRPITRFELWNEPNWRGFWCPGIDPAAYAAAARAAADAIHGVDPAGEVVLGGLAALKEDRFEGVTLTGMAVPRFLDEILAADPSLAQRFDAVAFHPYALDPDVNLTLLGWLRRLLVERGMGEAEIMLTEFGWKGGNLVDSLLEPQRAANYTEFAGAAPRTDCGVSAIAAHSWATDELDLFDPDDWWGIASPLTGALYPSGAAYAEQVALYEGRGPEPAPRTVITLCGAEEPPDQDADGTPDATDDYPTDPTRDSGSGETPSDPLPAEEPRLRPARLPDSFFGANVVELPSDGTELSARYAAMKDARISHVRQRFDWAYIERQPPAQSANTTGWEWVDKHVLKMALEGIRLRPSFGVAPQWALDSGDVDGAYADFMARFARRYGPDGAFWRENGHLDRSLAPTAYEIWENANGNAGAVDGSASAAEYAAMYVRARSALRAVDPQARAFVSLGHVGHAGDAAPFVRAMVAARPALRGEIDGAYVWGMYTRDPDAVGALARNVRGALVDTGNPQAPIQFGLGAPIGGPEAITEAERTAFFERATSRLARGDCNVDAVFAHAWTTSEANAENSWLFFGIAEQDNSLRGAGIAFRDTAAAFLGFSDSAPPRTVTHDCSAPAPDQDGDGVADAADPDPLDASVADAEAWPPAAPRLVTKPETWSNVRSPTFAHAADGAVSYQCRVDSGAFAGCSGERVVGPLEDGAHSFTVRAVDALGLVSPAARYEWTVDTQPPQTAIVGGPEGLTGRADVTFELTSNESGGRFACQLDSGQWNWCTASPGFTGLADGAHTFRAAAVDRAGNFDPSIEERAFEVRKDTDAPETTILSGPQREIASDAVEIRLASDESGVSFQCKLDVQAWAPCSDVVSYQGLADGPHVFQAYAVDEAGNADATPVVREFTVVTLDRTPPTLEWISPLAKRLRDRTPTVRFRARDDSGSVRTSCAVDARPWKACSSPYTTRRLRPGRHTVKVRATDPSGNRVMRSLGLRISRR